MESKRQQLIGTIFLSCLISVPVLAAEKSALEDAQPQSAAAATVEFPFKLFTASYRGEAYGMSMEKLGTRSLMQVDAQRYRIEYKANAMMYSMEETSDFIWQDNHIIPLAYHSERGTFLSKRKARLLFDWDAGTAEYKVKKRSGEFTISPGDQDPITSTLTLALKIDQKNPLIEVSEAKKDSVEMLEFERIDEPELQTPIGDIKTLHLRRIHDDPERQTEIWVHREYPYIPVKLRQNDDGEVFLLELTDLKLN
ncbi:MAG: DUF3108 domain-containing protein [Ketobacter sp.]